MSVLRPPAATPPRTQWPPPAQDERLEMEMKFEMRVETQGGKNKTQANVDIAAGKVNEWNELRFRR